MIKTPLSEQDLFSINDTATVFLMAVATNVMAEGTLSLSHRFQDLHTSSAIVRSTIKSFFKTYGSRRSNSKAMNANKTAQNSNDLELVSTLTMQL